MPDEEAINVDEESQIQAELEYNKTTTDKDTNSATAEVDNIRLSNFAFLVIFINLVSSFVNLSNAVENLNAQVKRLEWEKNNILRR